MIKTNRDEYDLLVSLGGSCSAASQLRHRGKRVCSFPLDWTLMADERPIRALPELFRNKFRDFCLAENMFEYEPSGCDYGVRRCHLEDRHTGYRVIHHFTAPPGNAVKYARERDVLIRRVNRLYAMMGRARSALFVLNTVFQYDAGLLLPVHDAIENAFPGVEVEIVALQFSAKECKECELRNGAIKVALVERPLNIVYDNQLTAPEWAWMDQVKLTGTPLPETLRKNSLSVKWAYKAWRHLGKWLEDRNAGCVSMRFLKFNRY